MRKAYDEKEFVIEYRKKRITPHATAKKSGGTVDGRSTLHESCRVSIVKRKQVEEPFGWAKTTGLMRKQRL